MSPKWLALVLQLARRRKRRQHLRNLIKVSEQYGLYDHDEVTMQELVRLRDATQSDYPHEEQHRAYHQEQR